MDAFQPILDMQMLAIEKTLLAADHFLQSGMGRDVAELVAHVSQLLSSTLIKMQQTGGYRASDARRSLKPKRAMKFKSFSHSTTSTAASSSARRRVSQSTVFAQAEEYAVTKMMRSLHAFVRAKKRRWLQRWKDLMLELELDEEADREEAADQHSSRVHFEEAKHAYRGDSPFPQYGEYSDVETEDEGPGQAYPMELYSASDGQPIDIDDLDGYYDHTPMESAAISTLSPADPSSRPRSRFGSERSHRTLSADSIDELYAELTGDQRSSSSTVLMASLNEAPVVTLPSISTSSSNFHYSHTADGNADRKAVKDSGVSAVRMLTSPGGMADGLMGGFELSP